MSELSRSWEGAQYSGVRVRFVGYLGKARVPMQIDVGFGDVLFPAAAEVQLPSVLALPPTVLLGYTRESVIAEKLQIMVALGEVNSRLRTTSISGFLPSATCFPANN